MHARVRRKLGRQAVGRLGESAVAWAFTQRGFDVLGRNVRTRFGEIDLIVAKADRTVFVEVKTRTSSIYGYPEEAVDFKKRVHLERSCQALASRYSSNGAWSILIVSVELDLISRTASLRRIELED